MECTVEKNIAACTCTYDVRKKGEMLRMRCLSQGEAGGARLFLLKSGEKTYDRSIRKLLDDRR